MEKKEVLVKLIPIFRKVLSDDLLDLTDELSAKDVENWDSLSHMLIITEIENCYSIKFKLKDLNKMRNIGDMVEIIISKM